MIQKLPLFLPFSSADLYLPSVLLCCTWSANGRFKENAIHFTAKTDPPQIPSDFPHCAIFKTHFCASNFAHKKIKFCTQKIKFCTQKIKFCT